MAADDRLIVEIEARTQRLEAGLKRTEQGMSRTSRSVERGATRIERSIERAATRSSSMVNQLTARMIGFTAVIQTTIGAGVAFEQSMLQMARGNADFNEVLADTVQGFVRGIPTVGRFIAGVIDYTREVRKAADGTAELEKEVKGAVDRMSELDTFMERLEERELRLRGIDEDEQIAMQMRDEEAELTQRIREIRESIAAGEASAAEMRRQSGVPGTAMGPSADLYQSAAFRIEERIERERELLEQLEAQLEKTTSARQRFAKLRQEETRKEAESREAEELAEQEAEAERRAAEQQRAIERHQSETLQLQLELMGLETEAMLEAIRFRYDELIAATEDEEERRLLAVKQSLEEELVLREANRREQERIERESQQAEHERGQRVREIERSVAEAERLIRDIPGMTAGVERVSTTIGGVSVGQVRGPDIAAQLSRQRRIAEQQLATQRAMLDELRRSRGGIN